MINIRMILCTSKLVILGFSGLYIFAKDGVIENTQPLFGDSYLFSAITIIGLIPILINYYARSAYKAEVQLTKEKELTEIQKVLLLDWHECNNWCSY